MKGKDMPFISIHISKKSTKKIKGKIKSEIGQIIELIPSKSESVLMIEIIDELDMAFAGKFQSDLCYVDIRCFGKASFHSNKTFGELLCQKLNRVLGIPIEHIYYTITEYDTWGGKGTLKQKKSLEVNIES